VNRRAKLSMIAPDASPDEAAAVVAALEQFMRATAPATVKHAPQRSVWQRTALREGVLRAEPQRDVWG
jgi:hypothetical protein